MKKKSVVTKECMSSVIQKQLTEMEGQYRVVEQVEKELKDKFNDNKIKRLRIEGAMVVLKQLLASSKDVCNGRR